MNPYLTFYDPEAKIQDGFAVKVDLEYGEIRFPVYYAPWGKLNSLETDALTDWDNYTPPECREGDPAYPECDVRKLSENL